MAYTSIPMELLRLESEGTPLTPAETRVLRLLAYGYNQVEVAERLGKSFETVRKQTKSIRARLAARNNTHAVAIAVAEGIV